jgi:hypothetical protein
LRKKLRKHVVEETIEITEHYINGRNVKARWLEVWAWMIVVWYCFGAPFAAIALYFIKKKRLEAHRALHRLAQAGNVRELAAPLDVVQQLDRPACQVVA